MQNNIISDTNHDCFCPTNEFKQGKPNGKCYGVGHYRCQECIFYREDFKENDIDYIEKICLRLFVD